MRFENLFHGTTEDGSGLIDFNLVLGTFRFIPEAQVAYSWAQKYAKDYRSPALIIRLSDVNVSEESFDGFGCVLDVDQRKTKGLKIYTQYEMKQFVKEFGLRI